MKYFFLILGICTLLFNNSIAQQHMIQLDLDNILKRHIVESDSTLRSSQIRKLATPTINYSFNTKKKISHSIRFSYYKVTGNNDYTYIINPTYSNQSITNLQYDNVSLGYALGKIFEVNDFLFHSQIIADFRVKSKYLENSTQRLLDTTIGLDVTYTDNIYFPKQHFISLYFKQSISHKLYKNLYLGLGLGYGLEYARFIGDRVITSDGPGNRPYLLVSNDGYYILQMNLFPSIGISFKFGKDNENNNN